MVGTGECCFVMVICHGQLRKKLPTKTSTRLNHILFRVHVGPHRTHHSPRESFASRCLDLKFQLIVHEWRPWRWSREDTRWRVRCWPLILISPSWVWNNKYKSETTSELKQKIDQIGAFKAPKPSKNAKMEGKQQLVGGFKPFEKY